MRAVIFIQTLCTIKGKHSNGIAKDVFGCIEEFSKVGSGLCKTKGRTPLLRESRSDRFRMYSGKQDIMHAMRDKHDGSKMLDKFRYLSIPSYWGNACHILIVYTSEQRGTPHRQSTYE